jgi:hypothetical protein
MQGPNTDEELFDEGRSEEEVMRSQKNAEIFILILLLEQFLTSITVIKESSTFGK